MSALDEATTHFRAIRRWEYCNAAASIDLTFMRPFYYFSLRDCVCIHPLCCGDSEELNAVRVYIAEIFRGVIHFASINHY